MLTGFHRIGLGLLLLALAAPAAQAGPRKVITRPDWAKKPTGDEMAAFFPQRASDEEVSGRATITCTVTVEGLLADCSVEDEKPEGYGFGDAALAAAASFRMSPKLIDGEPVAGGQVTIPLVFNVPKTEVFPGDMAMILTKGPSRAGGPSLETMPCPDGQGECQVHDFEWLARPDKKETARILASIKPEDGATYAACQVAAGGLLENCELVGDVTPVTRAAALAAIKSLKAPPATEDGLATASQTVMIIFSWEWLKLGPKEMAKRHPPQAEADGAR